MSTILFDMSWKSLRSQKHVQVFNANLTFDMKRYKGSGF